MRARLLAVSLLLLPACIGGGADAPRPEFTPEGPPQVQSEVIERHAEQFEQDLATRPAGSQQEFAAATYLTAHLQQGGYVVRLEDVPVANTVRSSNVIGLPPSGADPRIVVTVSYDTPSDRPDRDAGDIGAFLEVARALRVTQADHDVEFVALGAQSEDMLGARRLAQLLIEAEVEPQIVHLASTDEEAGLVQPLEDAGFPVERYVGSGTDIGSAVFALLTGAEG